MFGAEGDEVLALADGHVVLPHRCHRRRALVQDVGGVVALHVVEVVRCLAAVHRDRRGGVDPPAQGVALPRGGGQVLGHAVGVLGRSTLGRGVTRSGDGPGHVEQHQAQRPTGCGVGPVAGAEGTDAAVVAGAATTSPCTMSRGATQWVVALTPRRFISGRPSARTAEMSTARCSGRQPASTALTAMIRRVACPKRGGRVAMTSSGSTGPKPSSMAWTRAGVGATRGQAVAPTPFLVGRQQRLGGLVRDLEQSVDGGLRWHRTKCGPAWGGRASSLAPGQVRDTSPWPCPDQLRIRPRCRSIGPPQPKRPAWRRARPAGTSRRQTSASAAHPHRSPGRG